MANQAKIDLPLSFRAKEVESIMHYLAAGDSCSIVGIGSVGKSNLLRFLQRADVRQERLGEDWQQYLFIYVDTNKMLKQSAWGLMELILHQLMIELTNWGADKTVVETIDGLHQRATEPKTRYLTLRYLDRALGIACNQLNLKLVLLIDEFDDLSRTMSPRGFAALRALRDEFKYRLMYVVATRLELKRLRSELSEIEPFEELLSSHMVWLGPYSDEDARFMLQNRLGGRHQETLDEARVEEVMAATGGHPGLLREAYQVARETPADFYTTLAARSSVQDECQRVWLSLSAEEQQAVIGLASGPNLQPDLKPVAERLRHKSLVRQSKEKTHRLFSPLFADYVRQQHPVVGAPVYLDHKRHTVWVNGHEVRGLTPLEYKLVAYLEERRGQVCTRDDLALHLYPDDMALEGRGVTDTRLDSVVKRLRKRIEPNPKEPRYIVTVRGHGFRWAGGEAPES